MTIDERLFGDLFAGPSWAPWRACTAALFGEPMGEADLAVYRACTGRQTPPTRAAGAAYIIAGRRSGKSRRAAAWAVRLATRDYRGVLAPGEIGTIPVIAADRRQARSVFGYITGLLDSRPLLARLVVSQTSDSIELATKCRIEVHTSSFRSVRGYTMPAAILDEAAFYRTDDSATPDHELVAALLPAMATVKGLLLVISSPYARRGVLWDAHRKHYGRDGDPVLVWQAPTATMNPTVDPAIIAAAYEADEAAAAAEYGAEFRRDLEAFVSREVLAATTAPGRMGLPPIEGVRYVAFCDPSGGAQDSFTLAIAHEERREGTAIGVLDYLSERRPPFSPESVVAEYAQALKSYRVLTVQADKYAGEWVVEAFGRHGVTCQQSAEPKSVLYANLLPALNSGRVELLDHARLTAQLGALERRTARGGRDSIDHPPSGHDDLANAVAGALVQIVGRATDGLFEYVMRLPSGAAASPAPVAGGFTNRIVERTPAEDAARRERVLCALEREDRLVLRRTGT